MKKLMPVFLVMMILMLSYTAGHAQCAMCQGTVESSTDAGSSVALGINKGVLYIFMMPYLVISTLAYFWWRGRKKAPAENEQV